MASQVPFKKNTAANVGLCLYLNTGALITNPGTITAKISKDFGDYADIGTVTEEDSTYGQIKLALTNTEMNADVVMLYVVDNTSGCVPWTMTIYTAANLLDDIKTETASILEDTGTTLPATLGTPAGASLAADLLTLDNLVDDLEGRSIPLAVTTGSVVTSGGNNTASSFYTNLAGADNFWNDALILITSGALAGQVKEIGDFADENGVVTLTLGQAFTGTPADDVTFVIINR